MTLAPLRVQEAADSLMKASTPEPFSKSKTSNWVARAGGLPDYIQHLAHGIVRSGKTESEAIHIAVGLVQHPPAGWDANAHAAAKKAAAEWEAKKAANAAKVKEGYVPTFADEIMVREDALRRLSVYETEVGDEGMIALLGESLLEAAQAWAPTLKRTASAEGEVDRHEVYDGGQHVGTISRRRGFGTDPERHAAFAINGRRVSDYSEKSQAGAIKSLQSHLEEAPARVIAMPTAGKYLVARPQSYSGETTYTSYSTEAAARQSAGLPAQPTVPERNSKVEAVAEALRFDLMTVSGLDIPPLRRVQEARRLGPFDLIVSEAFHADEMRGRGGKWVASGHGVTAARYEGGVARLSAGTRSKMQSMFTLAEASSSKAPQPHSDLDKLYTAAEKRHAEFVGILNGVGKRLGATVHDRRTPEGKAAAKAAAVTHADRSHVVVAELKGKDRAKQKVDGKYAGDASKLGDVVRGTMLVPHVDDLPAAVAAIRQELPAGWSIVAPENRFLHGRRGDKVNVGPTSAGYRDMALMLRAPDGFHTELQINTTHMAAAKSGVGHKLYAQTRVIREAAHAGGRDLTAREDAQVKRLDAQAKAAYERALTQSVRARRASAKISR